MTKRKQKAKVLTNYLKANGSGWLIVLALALLPPLGIYWTCKYRRQWLKRWIVVAAIAVWSLIWLAAVCQSAEQSSTQIQTADTQSAVEQQAEPKNEQSAEQTDQAGQSDDADTQQQPAQSQTQPEQTPPLAGPMDGIAIAPAENAPYNRDDYEPDWDVGTGCDIRSRVLSSSSQVAVQYGSNGCTVKYGSWVDPYSGQTLTGNPYQGDGAGNDLDIDHIIPLKYVNEHGGAHWTEAQKRSYGASLEAMNNGVYIAVSASENREKSDSGPSEYYPPNPNYRCEYAKKWRDIARLYSISLTQADYNVVASTLASCGIN